LSCKEQKPFKLFSQQTIDIYNYQDKRLTDSLLISLSIHDQEAIALVCKAFGSVQDTAANPYIIPYLFHENNLIRRNAAFALGQTGGYQVAQTLRKVISSESDKQILITLLEAFGKTSNSNELKWLAEYAAESHTETEGIALALYRVGLRGLATDELVSLAFDLFESTSNSNTRLNLAHFFARSNNLNFAEYEDRLLQLLHEESDPEVLMALILASRKLKPNITFAILNDLYDQADDYRIKVNICRAMVNNNWQTAEPLLLKALTHEHPQVKIAAAESIRLNEQSSLENLIRLAREVNLPHAKALVYKQLLKHSHNSVLIEDLKQDWTTETNPYTKSFYTDLVLYMDSGIDTLKNIVLTNNHYVLQTAAITSLVNIDANNQLKESRNEQLEFYKKAMRRGDLAVIGMISTVLTNEKLNYKEMIKDISFLHEAKNLLELPRDNEALQHLDKCIAYFEGREALPVINAYNNPIDWSLLQQLNDSSRAIVKTNKGDIILLLLPKEAPGSVANFIKLSQDGYYSNKHFHRVVPNFVIQGGCYRGDGWGSENYSIRSEFGLRKYKTGSVGMASAGKDTEGTQWFITHSPTPHLDGGYTIFAEVIEGMDVVHQIEIGDKIIDIEIF
jgi:cyclophilin family peptidyl-prolyl cis-trans isomerase/HEAT repeat protein